jgi:hypothetical protein
VVPSAQPADIAWAAIISGAVTYELMAEDLLSDAADRYRGGHPWLVRVAVIALAGHLGGMLPVWADLFNARNVLHRSIRHAIARG